MGEGRRAEVPAPVTVGRAEALDEWIATVRQGETPDPELNRLVGEVLERWLDGETIEEILERAESSGSG